LRGNSSDVQRAFPPVFVLACLIICRDNEIRSHLLPEMLTSCKGNRANFLVLGIKSRGLVPGCWQTVRHPPWCRPCGGLGLGLLQHQQCLARSSQQGSLFAGLSGDLGDISSGPSHENTCTASPLLIPATLFLSSTGRLLSSPQLERRFLPGRLHTWWLCPDFRSS
jgi:hypothetical protein